MIIVTGSIDYDSGPYNVTFIAGEISVTLNISINDDRILESDETFDVTINTALLPINVDVVNNVRDVTVTIVDDDGK